MKPMIRLMKVAALTGLLLVSVSQSVFAMVCGGGYSSTESNHTVFEHACYEFFFNNSGAAMTSGLVAVYDISGTGVNLSRETGASRNEVDVNASDGDVDNVGTYITTTTTADSELVAGVVDDDSCADQSYCRVQVKGPRLVNCTGGDAPVSGDAVGTSATAGRCGDAANDADGTLGLALQATTGPDTFQPTWILIDPSRTD